jgi:hypothetical protein
VIAQPLIGLISSDFNKKFVLVDKPEGKYLRMHAARSCPL